MSQNMICIQIMQLSIWNHVCVIKPRWRASQVKKPYSTTCCHLTRKMNQKQQAVQHCLWSLYQSKGLAALTLKSDSWGISIFILLWSGNAHRHVITKPKDLQRAAGGHSGRHVICRLCNTAALEESNLALNTFVLNCSLDGRKASTCSSSWCI